MKSPLILPHGLLVSDRPAPAPYLLPARVLLDLAVDTKAAIDYTEALVVWMAGALPEGTPPAVQEVCHALCQRLTTIEKRLSGVAGLEDEETDE